MFFWHFGCLPKTCLEKTHAEVVELDYGNINRFDPLNSRAMEQFLVTFEWW